MVFLCMVLKIPIKTKTTFCHTQNSIITLSESNQVSNYFTCEYFFKHSPRNTISKQVKSTAYESIQLRICFVRRKCLIYCYPKSDDFAKTFSYFLYRNKGKSWYNALSFEQGVHVIFFFFKFCPLYVKIIMSSTINLVKSGLSNYCHYYY